MKKTAARLEAEDAKEEVLVAVAEEPEPPPRSGRTEPRPAELAAEAAKAEPGPAAPEARPAEPAAPKPEPAAESKPKKVVPPPPQGPKEEGMGVVPLAAFGLGAAALVSWGVFGALALADGGEFDEGMETPRTSGKGRKEMEALAEEVNLFGAVANVSLAVAAAAGLTGGAILLVSGDGSEAAAGVTWRW